MAEARMIQCNDRAFVMRVNPKESGWYPPRCDIGALLWCRQNKMFGSVAVDAGAHNGLYTLSIMGEPEVDEVFTFEANEDQYRFLIHNITENGYQFKDKKVHAFPYVVGDGGKVGFGYDRVESGEGRTSYRLDDLPKEPDFIKLDVEGHEEAVLKGGAKWFSGRANFYIELHPGMVEDYDFLWDYIDKKAYSLTFRGNELFGIRI